MINPLHIPLEAARRLFRRKPSGPPVLLTDPAWPQKLERLRNALSVLPPDDPLLNGLVGLIDANVRTELEPLSSSGLDDAEAHRLRGRVGMCLDLKADLHKLWREAQEERERQQRGS